MASQQRAHGLDLLRAILILIGIPYHTGLLLGDMNWVYNSAHHKSDVIPLLSAISHLFRMALFFFISGYFCHLVIEKKGSDFFWHSRLTKIALPLLTATLLVALPQAWLVRRVSPDHHVGSLVSHLWFLYCLLLMSALVLRWHAPLERRLRRRWPVAAGVAAIVAVLYVCAIMNRLIPDGWPLQLREVLKIPVRTLHYMPFFLLGFALKAQAPSVQRMMALPWWLSLAALLALMLVWFNGEALPGFTFAKPLLEALIPLLAIPLVFSLFLRDGFSHSPLVEFITRSALVVYVFHHPFIILYGYLLDPQPVSAWAYYLSVISLSVGSSVILYWLLRQFPLTRTAFGIKS
nr:acyltransferase family protein [Pantoea sp. 1.19]